MKANKAQIDQFLAPKKIAIAGVSRDKTKFGHQVFQLLIESNFKAVPINPAASEIDGIPCYDSIMNVNEPFESLLILTPKHYTDDLLENALQKGVSNIWIQKESVGPNTLKIALECKSNIILNQCIFMFIEPIKGVHKFHRFCNRLFGLYPN
ncbi:MAG: CoA-binding protein [Salinivirgaceae bacterium]|jgi:predicted CoA-binding protein|nr:CoA-binding protein [Salinivirgaceae bacterium]